MALNSRLRSLSLRDIDAIVVLAGTKHFGRAAEACGMTQPSFSALVQRVEHGLGRRLFDRTSRRCELTPDGVFAVEAITELLRGLNALEGRQRNDGSLRGAVRIGMIPTLGPYYTPHVLPAALRRFPEARFYFHEGLTQELEVLVRAGRLDVALLSLPGDASDLTKFALFEEELVMAFPRRHPLAQQNGPLRLSDVPHRELILPEHGHCLRSITLAVCGCTDSGSAGVQATGLETLRFMVGASVGCAVFPALAMKSQNNWKKLIAYRRFESPAPTRTIGLVSRSDPDALRVARALGSVLQGLSVRATL